MTRHSFINWMGLAWRHKHWGRWREETGHRDQRECQRKRILGFEARQAPPPRRSSCTADLGESQVRRWPQSCTSTPFRDCMKINSTTHHKRYIFGGNHKSGTGVDLEFCKMSQNGLLPVGGSHPPAPNRWRRQAREIRVREKPRWHLLPPRSQSNRPPPGRWWLRSGEHWEEQD